MRTKWIRGSENITFKRPETWMSLGVRGSGKSSFLEHVGEGYLEKGHCILDLFGSRDGENLAWCRSEWAKERKILLIHGDNVEVDCSFATKNVKDVRLKDFQDYDILISASPLYTSADQQFLETNRLTDLLYKRFTWKRLVYTVVREASNLYYSRLKVSDNQVIAKSSFIYMIREARHMGVALGLDTLRFYGIDIDIRSLSDYTLIKALGIYGLPKDLNFLYSYFDPHFIRNMKKDEFIVLTREGHLGWGIFPEVPWHKQEKENILKTCRIKLEYVEPQHVEEGIDRGIYQTVGDEEHAKMIMMWAEGQSSYDIGKAVNRTHRTALTHKRQHNLSIRRVGYCPRCRRAGSELEASQV